MFMRTSGNHVMDCMADLVELVERYYQSDAGTDFFDRNANETKKLCISCGRTDLPQKWKTEEFNHTKTCERRMIARLLERSNNYVQGGKQNPYEFYIA
jgi:hypothetical protein